MTVKRVLVAGGAGYIGSHAAKCLKLAGREPLVFDDLSSGHEHAVRWGPFVKGDIRNAEALRAAIRQYKPDAVMNFAARIEVGEGEKNPAHFYDNNVAGMLTLVRTMLEEGVRTFVFSSTCAIYGDPERLPLTEDLPKRPVSVYGRTKLMCEQMLEDMARAHGLKFAALRYFNAAGANPDWGVGEAHDPEEHLIPRIIASVLDGKALQVYGDDYPTPDGTCTRDYIHVTDLASAHLAVIEADGLASGRSFNVGTGRGTSVLEVIQAVGQRLQRQPQIQMSARRPGDPATLVADPSALREAVGWQAQHSSVEEIVDSAVEWELSRRAAHR